MQVAFFREGPDKPPMTIREMSQVPRVGDTVVLPDKEGYPQKYTVWGVEWSPVSDTVNLDVDMASAFG